MSARWKEVVRITFRGERFRDHALDVSALTKLGELQKMFTDMAKSLWRAANPGAQRLPKGFEARTRLCLRKIEGGSAVAPLEVRVDEEQQEFAEPEFDPINEAVVVTHQLFRAVERNERLPERFPKEQVGGYARWSGDLGEGEVIEIEPVGTEPAHVTSLTSPRLESFVETQHESTLEMTGEVFEADVRQGRFQMRLDDGTQVKVSFSPEQEETVTSALKDHKVCRLVVEGKAECSPEGKVLRVSKVDELQVRPVDYVPYDPEAPAIEDVLAKLASEVPEEEWDKLPPDLTERLDYYLYGTEE